MSLSDRGSFPAQTVDAEDERRLVSDFLESRDEASFLRLYRIHSPLLYRVIRRSLGPVDMVEDTLQETWVRAVAGLTEFRWASSLRTWLTGIALRCCHEARRSAAKGETTVAEGSTSTTLRAVPQRPEAVRIALEGALAELAPRRREVVVLHDVEGFTHAEIGAMLEIDPGTSKSQLFHARRQLREVLENNPQRHQSNEVAADER